jgi:hypothetical protein
MSYPDIHQYLNVLKLSGMYCTSVAIRVLRLMSIPDILQYRNVLKLSTSIRHVLQLQLESCG